MDRPLIRRHEGVGLELIDELRSAILEREAGPSFRSMNIGGWRTDETFFTWDVQAVQALRALVAARVGAGHIVGWSMINRRGSYHLRHNHRGKTSGIYYVDPGMWSLGGFGSGCTIIELPGGGEEHVLPVPGLLITFPSTTMHRVDPYLGERPRITIGFDVR